MNEPGPTSAHRLNTATLMRLPVHERDAIVAWASDIGHPGLMTVDLMTGAAIDLVVAPDKRTTGERAHQLSADQLRTFPVPRLLPRDHAWRTGA